MAAAGGDNSQLDKIKEALLGKKLDWESIEKSAETKVRSSDFMEEVKNEELKIKAEQDAEGDSDDEEHEKKAAAAAAGKVPSFIESTFTSRYVCCCVDTYNRARSWRPLLHRHCPQESQFYQLAPSHNSPFCREPY